MQQANTAQQQLDSSVGAAAPSLPSFLNIHLHSRYWLTVLTVLTDCPPPRRSGRGGGPIYRKAQSLGSGGVSPTACPVANIPLTCRVPFHPVHS